LIILLMGVSGVGKTTIGQLLAASLHWEFSDADAFHPPANIEKMRHGVPLNDADRMPWLQDLQTAIKSWLRGNRNVVLACSALKANYRQLLLLDHRVQLIYLKGSVELLQKRLQQRQNHFMEGGKLLQSQFDALEEPDNAICIDVSDPPEVIVARIREALGI
jgi:gluconokinase